MINMLRSACVLVCAASMAVMVSACGGASNGTTTPMPQVQQGASVFTTAVDRDTSNLDDTEVESTTSVLQQLTTQQTIGSTVDPLDGDQNPYGLDVAKSNSGKIKAGDLVICNFNNNNKLGNVQGQGTTIISLHPTPGSVPTHIARDAQLKGCTAIALAPGSDAIWAAAFVANDNPIVAANGGLLTALAGGPWHGPFGEAFSPHPGPDGGVACFYESNAGDGSIVRINIFANKPFTYDVIATGFPVNHGVPGSILGPSGLQYEARRDRLFIVDGANNAVYVLRHVSTIPDHGLSVDPFGKSFDGPFARRARLVYMGAPLNGPISSAVLFDGHLAIGNTGNPNGKNLIVEITPHGQLLFVRNVDTGAAGAIFGMVATGQTLESEKLYYNNDNDNTLRVLTK